MNYASEKLRITAAGLRGQFGLPVGEPDVAVLSRGLIHPGTNDLALRVDASGTLGNGSYVVPFATPVSVVMIGDSTLTQPPSHTIYDQLAAANPTWSVVSFAVPGLTLSSMITSYPTQAALRYSPTRAKNILFIAGASADWGAGDDQTATLSRIATLYALAIATGYFPIIATIPPNSQLDPPGQVKRVAHNTGLRATYTADHICDFDAIPQYSNPANTDIFSDGAHFTTAGAGLGQSALQIKIDAAPASVPRIGSIAGQNLDNVSILGGSATFSVLRVNSFTRTDVASFATSGLQFLDSAGAPSGGLFEFKNSGFEWSVWKASNVEGLHVFANGTNTQNRATLDVQGVFRATGLYPLHSVSAAGVTGNISFNRQSGCINIAAGATTLVVTTSYANANSNVLVQVQTNDATAEIKNIVAAAGSFTIRMKTAPTAETRLGFFVAGPEAT